MKRTMLCCSHFPLYHVLLKSQTSVTRKLWGYNYLISVSVLISICRSQDHCKPLAFPCEIFCKTRLVSWSAFVKLLEYEAFWWSDQMLSSYIQRWHYVVYCNLYVTKNVRYMPILLLEPFFSLKTQAHLLLTIKPQNILANTCDSLLSAY